VHDILSNLHVVSINKRGISFGFCWASIVDFLSLGLLMDFIYIYIKVYSMKYIDPLVIKLDWNNKLIQKTYDLELD